MRNFKVINETIYNLPNAWVEPYHHNFHDIFIEADKRWPKYFKRATRQILVNYISHEATHLVLHKIGESEACNDLDNFSPYILTFRSLMKHRKEVIAEPTGLESVLQCLDHKCHHKRRVLK